MTDGINAGANKSASSRTVVIGAVMVLGLIVCAVLWFVLRQPTPSDYLYAKDTGVPALSDAQNKLDPAANTYITTLKKAYDETGSVSQAKAKAKSEYDAFKRIETEARETTVAFSKYRISNNKETAQTVEQVEAVATARINYFSSLVERYAEYRATFGGANNTVCADLFIGKARTFAERKQGLRGAIVDCYEALPVLKDSQNPTYRDYALKLEKRLKLLEQDIATATAAEKKYEEYLLKKDEYDARIAAADQRNASDEEYEKIEAEVRATNRQMNDDEAALRYASSRYAQTIKELPVLYDATFSSNVLQKREHFKSLLDTRLATLRAVLEYKLID